MTDSFNVNKKTILFGYLTQFFQYCVNILILPIILASVDSSTLGIWYLFLSVSSLVMLLDFGFSTSLTKNVSYVFAGAKELIKDGCVNKPTDSCIDFYLLKSLIYTTKTTYGKISATMLALLLTAGTYYIFKTTNGNDYIIVWLFFAFSISINYYFNYINIFIRGRGLVELSNRLIIITKILYLVAVAGLLWLNLGLWALVLANFISAFGAILVGRYYFWDEELISNLKKVEKTPNNLFPILWYNAKRMGVTGFTIYAYSQFNVLMGGIFLSLSDVAKLGLCMQLFGVLITISRVNLNTYYPKICSLWVTNDKAVIRKIFLKAQIICYVIYILGCITIILGGTYILDFINSKTQLPETGVLCLYAFFYFMEITHGNCAIVISSNNKAPFYKSPLKK